MMDIEAGQGAGLKLWTSLTISKNGPNSYTTTSFNVKYSLSSWLSASASVPFRTINTERLSTLGKDEYTLSGVGDASLFAFGDLSVFFSGRESPADKKKSSKEDFFKLYPEEKTPFDLPDELPLTEPSENKPNPAKPHFSVGLGFILPTGEDDTADAYGYFPPEAQLGSGTFNVLAGGSYYQKLGDFQPYASLFWQFTGGENGAGLDRGDKLIWSLGVNYSAAPGIRLTLSAEISGMTSVRDDRQDGVRVPDSHGSLMFFSPGAKMKLCGSWDFKLKCLLPLWKNTDSSENDLDFSLSVYLYCSF